jgi:hypothetical protein
MIPKPREEGEPLAPAAVLVSFLRPQDAKSSRSRRHLGFHDERRWDEIEASLGQLASEGHDWDGDAATWVRDQRTADSRRAG